MGRWLLLAATAAVLAGCSDQRGRYVVAGGNPPIMVDSTTGETWRLIYDEGNNPRWIKLAHDIEPPHQ